MDRESFLETIRKQYADEIHEAYLECEHENGRQVDFGKLNMMLKKLMTNALAEGLSSFDFEDLVRSTLPQVAGQISFLQKKAA